MSEPTPRQRWRDIASAGHRGDAAAARLAVTDPDPGARRLALGALDRLGELSDAELAAAFSDPVAAVRRRALELAATRPGVDLLGPLHDDDPTVVEVAAWACGEHVEVGEAVLIRLLELAAGAEVLQTHRGMLRVAVGRLGLSPPQERRLKIRSELLTEKVGRWGA